MKIEQAHIDQIRKQFAELQSKDDLVKLLSDAKNMLYSEECKPIQLKSLTYYANPVLCKKRYQTFIIKKKSGADRIIHAPAEGLTSILRALNFVLQCMYVPHKAVTGFVLEKSIVDNAKKHVGHHYVLNIDLKDFFHSFDRNRVKMGFMFEPFNLNGDKEPLAFLLASLCTHPFEIDGEVKTVLPQGSPTSPTITNILCKKLDRRLTGLANRFGVTYTRYADDITFSSPHNIYNDEAFNKELKRIIEEDQKLVVNPKKTRLQKTGYRQEVTGLIVNDKVNVRRRYVKQIRMWLYYWEKYGYAKAEQIFKRDYVADKGHVKNINVHLVNVLDGKLEFLKMVKGTKDETYKKLKERYENLAEEINPISQLLNVWEKEGIEKAMEVYYDKEENSNILIEDLF
ncbi:MAG: RNA-directed DNA polymerase [Flavobacteriales bacterium]|nr:RNA-directed DNA polymerase [Flavobacteriales bacterium]MCZ2247198.1 reverse transcriptase family protein [Bacteroidia bacterium]